MYRIRRNVSVLPIESDFDHNKVVNVLQVLADGFLGVVWIAVSDNQVPRGTDANLVGNMRW